MFAAMISLKGLCCIIPLFMVCLHIYVSVFILPCCAFTLIMFYDVTFF